jgi:ComF family protein
MDTNFITLIKNQICHPIINVFFPPICYICECYLPQDQKIICRDCWNKIPVFSGPLDQSLKKRSFDELYILFEFQDTIRQLIHLLKYKAHLTLAAYFAQEAIRRFNLSKSNLYTEIIPVPLYKTRIRERGYNQSEEIARIIAQRLHIPLKSEHLQRIRSTSTQTRMSREERERNVSGAFICPENIDTSRVLLVDDVVTTGSTTEECVKSLRAAGAEIVDILVIAHPLENT